MCPVARAAESIGMRRASLFPVVIGSAALCSALGLATLRFEAPAEATNPASHMSAVHATPPSAGSLPVTDVTPPRGATLAPAIAEARATPLAPAPAPPDLPASGEVANPRPVESATPPSSPPLAPDSVATLPAAVSQPSELVSVDDKAVELLAAMNAARATEGLAPLQWDEDLASVALARATDLIRRGYFDHYAPDGSSAFSELAVRGIRYALAGENLARNNYAESRTVAAAFQGLMGSPGHRANILEPRFQHVGIAAVRSGRVWLYVTVFTD